MIAALPMYLWPANMAAHDRLWAGIRDDLRGRGIPAPQALDHATGHMAGWARPDLVLSMICNLPYRAQFRGRVTKIGVADYALPGLAPGQYNAVLIVRADDPAQGFADAAHYPMAFNEPLSNSGWGMAHAHGRALGLTLNPALRSGSHRASLAAVVQGRAGLAALDAVTWVNMQRWDPNAALARVIAVTPPSPGMTFVTAAGRDPAPYHAAIAGAIDGLSAADRDVLGLRGIVALPEAAYDIPLPDFPPGFAP